MAEKKSFIKPFLATNGNSSLIRLIAFMCACVGLFLLSVLAVADFFINKCANYVAIGGLCTTIIMLGLGGKLIQKKDEVSLEAKSIEAGINPETQEPYPKSE